MSWVKGRTIVITGGSSGIGKAIAFAVAGEGGRVVLASRTQARLDDGVEQIRRAGGEAIAQATDVGDADAVEALMERAVAEFGTIDGLVTAAGLGRFGPLLEQDRAAVEETVATDLLGTIWAVQSAGRRMAPGSQIITVASSMAGNPSSTMALYASVKSAVVVLSDGIRAELAQRGIRLSCLLPGGVATHFQDGWGAEETSEFGVKAMDDSGALDLSHVMRARDIAPAVLFAFDLPERSRGANLSVV